MLNHCKNRLKHILIYAVVFASVFLTSCQEKVTDTRAESVSLEEIPEYTGEPYIEIDENEPDFTEEELVTDSYESYSELDDLGRCGEVSACIGEELMPTEKRGEIGQVKPTGWHTVKYEEVDGKYLYNRCHLIAYQLSGENANEKNLITGTRYMNTEGMLPFENEVAKYVKDTGNHVMYRVTPIFEEDNLVASGVQMEAESVEDHGEGVSYNIYVYNVQPGINIDYENGDSTEEEDVADSTKKNAETKDAGHYIINKNTRKFHKPDCGSVAETKARNIKEYFGDKDSLIEQGYEPCGRCKP